MGTVLDIAGKCEVCGENILVPMAKLDSEKGKTVRRFHRECRNKRHGKNKKA